MGLFMRLESVASVRECSSRFLIVFNPPAVRCRDEPLVNPTLSVCPPSDLFSDISQLASQTLVVADVVCPVQGVTCAARAVREGFAMGSAFPRCRLGPNLLKKTRSSTCKTFKTWFWGFWGFRLWGFFYYLTRRSPREPSPWCTHFALQTLGLIAYSSLARPPVVLLSKGRSRTHPASSRIASARRTASGVASPRQSFWYTSLTLKIPSLRFHPATRWRPSSAAACLSGEIIIE